MLLHLDAPLTLLILFSVCVSLPSPQHVTMNAVDMNYTLWWDWSYTQTLGSITFTTEYTYWNEREVESSYKRVCEGTVQRWCDFTQQRLPFSGSYYIRVRAEAAGQRSNWTCVRFTPDEDVCVSLPSPQRVTLNAVDLNYTLWWDWSYTQTLGSITFTTEYTYWNEREVESSYKRVCEGTVQRWCDFTQQRLPFSGSYYIRVRAEAAGQRSNWTCVRFTPDEDVQLGPPSAVSVMGDLRLLLLSTSNSPMSSKMKLQYRVLYWESQRPHQKHQQVFEHPYIMLGPLRACTEYCVQLCVFSLPYNKSSTLTPEQCAHTRGPCAIWQKVVSVLGCILVLVIIVCVCCRIRKTFSAYSTPSSIQGLPTDLPPLMVAQEVGCAVPLVTPWLPRLDVTLEEQEHTGRSTTATSDHWSNRSAQDSGIGSG